MLASPAEARALLVQSICWAFRHTDRTVSETVRAPRVCLMPLFVPSTLRECIRECCVHRGSRLSLGCSRTCGRRPTSLATSTRRTTCSSSTCVLRSLPRRAALPAAAGLGCGREGRQSAYVLHAQDIVFVLTDQLHKSSLKMHAAILQHMFALVETGEVRSSGRARAPVAAA